MKKKLFSISLVLVVLLIIFLLIDRKNYIGDFVGAENGLKINSSHCVNCFLKIETKTRPSEKFYSTLTIDVFGPSENLIVNLKKDDYYSPSFGNNKYNFYIKIFTYKNNDYLLTEEPNSGSGGGGNYHVYKIDKFNINKLSSGGFYSCNNPYLTNNGELIFINNGSHCDFLDNSIGPKEVKKLRL